jgi:hypothetical protein
MPTEGEKPLDEDVRGVRDVVAGSFVDIRTGEMEGEQLSRKVESASSLYKAEAYKVYEHWKNGGKKETAAVPTPSGQGGEKRKKDDDDLAMSSSPGGNGSLEDTFRRAIIRWGLDFAKIAEELGNGMSRSDCLVYWNTSGGMSNPANVFLLSKHQEMTEASRAIQVGQSEGVFFTRTANRELKERNPIEEWSARDAAIFLKGISIYGLNFNKIASYLPGRNGTACQRLWIHWGGTANATNLEMLNLSQSREGSGSENVDVDLREAITAADVERQAKNPSGLIVPRQRKRKYEAGLVSVSLGEDGMDVWSRDELAALFWALCCKGPQVPLWTHFVPTQQQTAMRRLIAHLGGFESDLLAPFLKAVPSAAVMTGDTASVGVGDSDHEAQPQKAAAAEEERQMQCRRLAQRLCGQFPDKKLRISKTGASRSNVSSKQAALLGHKDPAQINPSRITLTFLVGEVATFRRALIRFGPDFTRIAAAVATKNAVACEAYWRMLQSKAPSDASLLLMAHEKLQGAQQCEAYPLESNPAELESLQREAQWFHPIEVAVSMAEEELKVQSLLQASSLQALKDPAFLDPASSSSFSTAADASSAELGWAEELPPEGNATAVRGYHLTPPVALVWRHSCDATLEERQRLCEDVFRLNRLNRFDLTVDGAVKSRHSFCQHYPVWHNKSYAMPLVWEKGSMAQPTSLYAAGRFGEWTPWKQPLDQVEERQTVAIEDGIASWLSRTREKIEEDTMDSSLLPACFNATQSVSSLFSPPPAHAGSLSDLHQQHLDWIVGGVGLRKIWDWEHEGNASQVHAVRLVDSQTIAVAFSPIEDRSALQGCRYTWSETELPSATENDAFVFPLPSETMTALATGQLTLQLAPQAQYVILSTGTGTLAIHAWNKSGRLLWRLSAPGSDTTLWPCILCGGYLTHLATLQATGLTLYRLDRRSVAFGLTASDADRNGLLLAKEGVALAESRVGSSFKWLSVSVCAGWLFVGEENRVRLWAMPRGGSARSPQPMTWMGTMPSVASLVSAVVHEDQVTLFVASENGSIRRLSQRVNPPNEREGSEPWRMTTGTVTEPIHALACQAGLSTQVLVLHGRPLRLSCLQVISAPSSRPSLQVRWSQAVESLLAMPLDARIYRMIWSLSSLHLSTSQREIVLALR